jgi:hypothetical protein
MIMKHPKIKEKPEGKVKKKAVQKKKNWWPLWNDPFGDWGGL